MTSTSIDPNRRPCGGTTWSGVGVEHGPWGLGGFTELQVIHRAHV